MSLANINTKIVSKALSEWLKNVVSSLFQHNTANIENRIIGEGNTLISGIVDICCRNNAGGYLITMDIEKAFGSSLVKFLVKALSPELRYY